MRVLFLRTDEHAYGSLAVEPFRRRVPGPLGYRGVHLQRRRKFGKHNDYSMFGVPGGI